MIPRHEAEQARRRAIDLETGSELAAYPGEASECAALWNAFCAQEQAALDDRDRRARRGTPASWLYAGRGSGARR